LKGADQQNLLAPFKVWEEKPIYLFAERFVPLLLTQPIGVQNVVLRFLTSTIEGAPQTIVEDLTCRKFLEVLVALLSDTHLTPELEQIFITFTLDRIETLIELRYRV
jgi:hypothetical protein